jgi:hypothetical protein
MRRIFTGLLASVLTLGLLAAGPAEAKVYKMKPEERAAALNEKKARKAKKKAGKATDEAPGGWVEVKPGAKPERKAKKSAKVDDIAKAAEKKGKKSKKTVEASAKPEKKSTQKVSKRTGKKAAAQGDRVVGKSYTGESVRGASTEVRRSGAAAGAPAGDDLSAYSVNRPGQEKPAASAAPTVIPEVRQEVQPGPMDTAKPVGTEHKAGEGRF